MSPSLPYLCLREIFLHSDPGSLFSCALICKFWSETAIPILWKDTFYYHSKMIPLIDIYLSSFTLEELNNLNLPSNLIEDYHKRRPKYNYAEFLNRMNLTEIQTSTSFWLESKLNEFKENISNCQIFKLLCSHFISNAKSIKYIESCPDYNSLLDFNIFNLPGAEFSLSGLREFSCYGEMYKNLYERATKISTTIHNLKISLIHGCPINSSTLIDISNYVRSQRQLKEFSIDNRIGCYCCPPDLSLALDLTIIFKSLNTQSTTLSRISLVSINFHNYFPLDQLSQCKNLKELNITRCWNFGDTIGSNFNAFTNLSNLQITLSSIPEELIKILLTQSGKSLRNLEFEEIFNEIIWYCSKNNPNLVKALVYIDPKEIQHLPKFLRSSTKLCNLELWDKNMLNEEKREMKLIDLDDELFSDIGDSLPNSLTNLTINMKWKFSSKSLERFMKNCKAPLDSLGFGFCECFDNECFNILIKNLKRPLELLDIRRCSAKLGPATRKKNQHLIKQINLLKRKI